MIVILHWGLSLIIPLVIVPSHAILDSHSMRVAGVFVEVIRVVHPKTRLTMAIASVDAKIRYGREMNCKRELKVWSIQNQMDERRDVKDHHQDCRARSRLKPS